MNSPIHPERRTIALAIVFAVTFLLTFQMTSASRLFNSPISPISPPPTPVAHAPLVIRVEPENVFEGTTQRVAIRGTYFNEGARPSIGEVLLEDIKRLDSTWLIATVPATLPQGLYDLKVCNPDGQCGLLPQSYRVIGSAEPVLGGIVPPRGFNDAPTYVLVGGLNFRPGMTLTLGNTPMERVAVLAPGLAVAVVPAGLPVGTYDVVATNPGSALTGTLPQAFTVLSLTQDDLYVGQNDLWTSPATAHEGSPIVLGVNLRRIAGNAVLDQVPVAFYASDGEHARTLIGSTTAGDVQPGPGSVTPATVAWNTSGFEGSVIISVVIDPENTVAESSKDNNTAQRRLTLLPVERKRTPPEPPRLTVNAGALTTTLQQVTVQLDSDPRATSMYLSERVFNAAAHEWVAAQDVGWLPLSASSTMTLTNQAGIHYLQSWVADNDGNISAGSNIVRINYLPSTQAVANGRSVVYRQTLQAGQAISATLRTLSGDADLYLWGPEGNLLVFGNQYDLSPDHVEYAPGPAGEYQVEVRGYLDSEYELSLWVGPAQALGTTGQAVAAASAEGKTLPAAPAIALSSIPSEPQGLPNADVGPQVFSVFLPLNMLNYQAPDPRPLRVFLPLLWRW